MTGSNASLRVAVEALLNSGMMRNEIASFQTGFHTFNQQRPLNKDVQARYQSVLRALNQLAHVGN